jgi:hypothetical protein
LFAFLSILVKNLQEQSITFSDIGEQCGNIIEGFLCIACNGHHQLLTPISLCHHFACLHFFIFFTLPSLCKQSDGKVIAGKMMAK